MLPVIALTAFAQADKPTEKLQATPKRIAPFEAGFAPKASIVGQNAFGVSPGGGNLSLSTSSSAATAPLLVRFSGGEDEANPVMEEDLNIMTHLIERSLQNGIGDDPPEVKSGIPILLSDSRSVRGMYLDGFGALFMIKVRFPVFAPGVSEPKEPQTALDSDWERARREVYNDAEARTDVSVTVSGGSQYDADQVEGLKKLLLHALKNATNIRGLKGSEFVGITVFGSPLSSTQTRKSRSKTTATNPFTSPAARNDAGKESQSNTAKASASATAQRSSNQGTVLTIRVKKSDADAFAQGQLDFDGFQKKAEQHGYLGNGYGLTSLNSWSRSGASAR